MRVLLFTGKGGVGKTTVAAATAVRCAADGHRTLIVSTDPAHSRADAFDGPLGDRPTPIGDGLWVAAFGTFPARTPEPTRAGRRDADRRAHRGVGSADRRDRTE